ncbi:MAG: hypothetical protein MJZ90_09170 [Bacteroidales bacterium]|nr:hypothetical protein [Bacteroidales bacterium]
MIQYPIYCSIAETNDSIAGSIVAVETHGRASLQCGNGRASLQYDTNNPINNQTTNNPLKWNDDKFFQL